MEEVWKDINLSTLHPVDDPHNTSFRGVIFQDFLARPLDKRPPSSATVTSPPPPPPPPTVLTLNSGPNRLNFFSNPDSLRPSPCSRNTLPPDGRLSQGFMLDSSSNNGNNKLPEFDHHSRERRHKRMMKNRESAARSRARKQAYTNELELEVANLLEENAMLKKQQQQLYLAAVSQPPKKPTLQRTFTAPF